MNRRDISVFAAKDESQKKQDPKHKHQANGLADTFKRGKRENNSRIHSVNRVKQQKCAARKINKIIMDQKKKLKTTLSRLTGRENEMSSERT